MKATKKNATIQNGKAISEQENVEVAQPVLSVVKNEAEQQPEEVQQQAEQPAEAAQEVKPLTVAEKLQALQDLGRVAIQRSNLIGMMDALKRFEIKQTEAAELDEGNLYKTCQLILKDDHGVEFCTKNTALITATVEHLLAKSKIRLEEIEAQLIFPAAA